MVFGEPVCRKEAGRIPESRRPAFRRRQDGVGLPQSPLYYALEDFLKSAIEGQPVVCGAEEGMRATIVGILANRAVRDGETIAIDPDSLKVG